MLFRNKKLGQIVSKLKKINLIKVKNRGFNVERVIERLSFLALCQVRVIGKNHSRNLGSILLLRFFLTFFKFDIIFIFRNK